MDKKHYRNILLPFILLAPVSRIYPGIHWLTDVVVGFLLGIFCLAMLSYYYLKKAAQLDEIIYNKDPDYLKQKYLNCTVFIILLTDLVKFLIN
jgi:PAP2 superfamily